jgi:hypothetical protein
VRLTILENFIKYAQGADVVIHEVGVARPELLRLLTQARRNGEFVGFRPEKAYST